VKRARVDLFALARVRAFYVFNVARARAERRRRRRPPVWAADGARA